MAVTRTEVTELYIAFFDRAPDSTGLDYWVNDSGLTIEEISQSFFDQTETQEKYPDTLTDPLFVNEIYENIFSRVADPDGLDYWVNELETGSITRANMILAIANGAQDTTEFGNDKTILDNKTKVGLDFADSALSDVDQAKSVMANVDDTDASVTAAENQIDEWAKDASTSDFTTARDTLEGTDGDDIFNGKWTPAVATDTYQAKDAADGKDGNDTLTITNTDTAATATTGATTVTNVETLHIVQNVANATSFTVDASNFDASFTNLKVDGSTGGTGPVIVGTAATAAAGLDSIVDIELNGLNAGANTVTVNYAPAAVIAGNDASAITLDNGVTSIVATAGIENYTIHTKSGAQALTVNDASVATAGQSVTVDGGGNLNLTLGTATTHLHAADATGNLSFTGAVVAAGGEMELGSGNDTVLAANLAGAATVSLGAGNDTITAAAAGGSVINGEAGNDALTAGAGGDTLNGGAGLDTLIGAAKTDVFKYDSHSDSTLTSLDTIATFTSGTDTINVSEAVRASQGDTAVTGAATTSFTSAAAGLAEGAAYIAGGLAGVTHAYLDTATNNIYIDINQDNKYNAADDLVINVSTTITATDVIV